MLAFLIVLALFAFWSLVGFAVVSLLQSRRNLLRNALLSPITGAAVTVLIVSPINAAGVPVRASAPYITAALAIGALLLIVRLRPILPLAPLRPFVIVLSAAALLVGYPFFLFGFNWVSYCNDDMANYCLSAQLFLNHGFYHLPTAQTFIHDRDPSLFQWFYEVLAGIRPGCEETLAWVAGTTHLDPHQIFMVTIVALHLILISTAAAFLLTNRRYRAISLMVCGWVAVAGLITLGTVYQLIAQVFGLALLTGASTLLLRPFNPQTQRVYRGSLVLAAILIAAMGIAYPELTPFLALAFLLYHLVLLARRRETFQNLAKCVIRTAICGVLFLGVFLPGTFSTLLSQASGGLRGTSTTDNILFPYYLMPSGFAYLWGFFPIGRPLTWILQPYVLLGLGLFLLTLAGAVWLLWRGEACAAIFLVMGLLAIHLFRVRSDFGLYKIAMYMQPYMLAAAGLLWTRPWVAVCALRRSHTAFRRYAPLIVLAALGVQSQAYYVYRSTALGASGGFVEIPNASGSKLISELHTLSLRPHAPVIVSDTPNVVLAKFESLYFTGSSLFFPARDYFKDLIRYSSRVFTRLLALVRPGLVTSAIAIREQRTLLFRKASFDMHGAGPAPNEFEVRAEIANLSHSEISVIESPPNFSILNRRSVSRNVFPARPRIVPSSQLHNSLIFVDSTFGVSYFFGGANRGLGRVSMYQPEDDWFFRNRTMVALGRDSLFRVVNPTAEVRLFLEYSASLNGDRRNAIPPASVIGEDREFLHAVGRGSARLISAPIRPQVIQGGYYIMLDMGTWGSRFPDRRSGVMRLYGTDVPLDSRRVVGFTRDISAMSDQEYSEIRPPTAIRQFPSELQNKALEYSGIYEDGWVGESSYLKLRSDNGPENLLIRVMVPRIGKPQSADVMTVQLDGREVGRRRLVPGENEFRSPAPSAAGNHDVELQFNRSTTLPAPDGRPVSALIRAVAFEHASALQSAEGTRAGTADR